MDFPVGASKEAIEQYSDARWRLENLYYIKNERGERVLFKPNWVQDNLLDEMWYLNLYPKARQLGITTAIVLFQLDACIWNPGVKAATIADTEAKAKEIFDEKVKFAYDNLPDWIKAGRAVEKDNAHGIEFDNGSSYIVGVSVRGLTLQYLHISELGKIAADSPLKAEEIRTGALNTVHAGQFIFVESTARGQAGLFFELCKLAEDAKKEGRPLSQLGFKLHFYAWWMDARYELPPEEAKHVVITTEDEAYFAKIEAEMGIELSREQRAWYLEKRRTQGDKMKQEYPSTPGEPFEQSAEGAYFSKEMTQVRLRGRLRRLPWLAHIPVNSFWDLGHSDYTTVWLHQYVHPWNRFLAYYQNSGEQLAHYVAWMQRTILGHGGLIGTIYLPHDATHMQGPNVAKTSEELMRELLPGANVVVVERPNNKYHDGIEMSRRRLPECEFDEVEAAEGVKCLDHYRKQWNEQLACWRDDPLHDWASHGYDGFEQFARGFTPGVAKSSKRGAGGPRSFRTV